MYIEENWEIREAPLVMRVNRKRYGEINRFHDKAYKLLCKEGSKYKYRHYGRSLFKRSGDFFIDAYLGRHNGLKGEAALTVSIDIKTIVMDDLAWVIFDHPENFSMPISVRVEGDNVVGGLPVAELTFKVPDETDEGLEALTVEMMRTIAETVDQAIASIDGSREAFNQFIIDYPLDRGGYGFGLTKMLAMVDMGDYLQAALYTNGPLEQVRTPPGFQGSAYTPMMEYCMKKMKEDSVKYPDAAHYPELTGEWWNDPAIENWLYKWYDDPAKYPTLESAEEDDDDESPEEPINTQEANTDVH